MAGIGLKLDLDYKEIVERLKQEGWVRPVRCKNCKHGTALTDFMGTRGIECHHYNHPYDFNLPDWYCADGEYNA